MKTTPKIRTGPRLLMACFTLLVVSSAVLSHAPFTSSGFPWPLLSGVLLFMMALAAIFRMVPSGEPRNPPPLPISDKAVFLILMTAAIVTRFFRLTSFSTWPFGDEGMCGYFSMELSHCWKWDLFYGPNQMPPLFLWGLGLTFKTMGVGLLSLWFFPALISLITVIMAWWAALVFGSRAFAFLVGILCAFSFWPNLLGRLPQPGVMIPLFAMLTFGLMGRIANTKDGPARNRFALGLGISTGLGLYAYLSWLAAAMTVCLWMVYRLIKYRGKQMRSFLLFLFPFLILAAPLVVTISLNPYGSYIQSLWELGSNNLDERWVVSLSYLTGLFFRNLVAYYYYGPIEGGFLNPVLAAAFFVGLIGWMKYRPLHDSIWMMGGALLVLLPGLLSGNVEFFRISAFLPWLLFFSARGLLTLVSTRKMGPRAKGIIIVFCLVVSTLLDYRHFAVSYRERLAEPSGPFESKTVEYYRAWTVLKDMAHRNGPGYLFDSLIAADPLYDRSLEVATHSFNAAVNPGLHGGISWFAVLTNADYQSVLARRFPEASWFPLSSIPRQGFGRLGLVVMPITRINQAVVTRWVELDRVVRPILSRTLHASDEKSMGDAVRSLSALQKDVKDDPYLYTNLLELAAVLARNMGAYDTHLRILRQAMAEGIPTAHGMNKIGLFLDLRGDVPGARKAWEKALEIDPDDDLVRHNLDSLPVGEKGSSE